jgi:hypothetical protein
MRGTDRLVLAVALVMPLVLVVFGWPMVVRMVASPSPAPATPTAPASAATSAAAARASQPQATPRPTVGAPATLIAAPAAANTPPAPTPVPKAATPAAAEAPTTVSLTPGTRRPVATPTTAPAAAPRDAPPAADPTQVVSDFYALVSSHDFESAAQLWSPRMRAAFPPDANIAGRFSQTQSIRLERADVVSQDQSRATVAVDVVEADARAGQRHFVGAWHLVRTPGGWALDQPELQAAP